MEVWVVMKTMKTLSSSCRCLVSDHQKNWNAAAGVQELLISNKTSNPTLRSETR